MFEIFRIFFGRERKKDSSWYMFTPRTLKLSLLQLFIVIYSVCRFCHLKTKCLLLNHCM